MENSRSCKNCRNKTLIPDDVTGNTVCSSCGVVQDYDNFQAHIGGINGPTGTFVRVGTVGTGGSLNYTESKVYEAQKLIEDFMFRLDLSGSKSMEVKLLVEKITEGEYGVGNWFPVFVGACAYVVMRKEGKKMLPIVEVANMVGCDVHELGKMIGRVVDFVDLKLPEFDIVDSFERAVNCCSSFTEVSEDVVKKMLQQGVFLVQCLIKWCITTGRTPMPVVAAVLVFVGELNHVSVKIEDVALELHVAVVTCKRRYKELMEALVKVAGQVLPWGKDVNMKNISKNAPFVIQYMEMKSMNKCGKKRKSSELEFVACDIEGIIDDCLNKEIGYSFDSYNMGDYSSQYFEVDGSSNLIEDCPDKFQISSESLSMLYSNFVDDVSLIKSTAETGNKRKWRKSVNLDACIDWWKGKSDMGKKLMLKQILEKDVGWDTSPPSFQKGCLVREKRREKIKAAKLRIQKVMHPKIADSSYSNYQLEVGKNKKRKKMKVDIDWEDLIIETLLLHNVKEEKIENGYYNVLLDLHVFNDNVIE